jgi:hypothetical protein
VSRANTSRVSGGAPSSTTNPKAPLRRMMSAHHALRGGVGGRRIHAPSCAAKAAQSAGAKVPLASITAVHVPVPKACATHCHTNDVAPLPGVATTSVSRPRGSPPPLSAASSAAIPVGNVALPTCGRATTVANAARNATNCEDGAADGARSGRAAIYLKVTE